MMPPTQLIRHAKISLIATLFFYLLGPHAVAIQSDFQNRVLNGDNEFAALIEKAKAAIVAVGIYHFNSKPAVRFFGTGFAIENGDRIVTNNHVIASIKEKKRLFNLRVFNKNLPGKGVKAKLVAEDEFHDLAILEVEGVRLPALPLEKETTVKEGHTIAITGYPIGFVLGLNPTTNVGIISAIAPVILPSPTARIIDKNLVAHLKKPFDIFQLDATAFPGNSGSPVYRIATGEVVGVVNMVFVKGKKEHVLKDPTGITYAIPIKHVKELSHSIQFEFPETEFSLPNFNKP